MSNSEENNISINKKESGKNDKIDINNENYDKEIIKRIESINLS